jgi:RNA polymerase sigma-70 factor (ECF subfamily)
MTTPLPEDAELVARAREGDAQAFRQLVERYQSVVASVVIGMLGRGADADDVGQETFIRFYRALHDFRGDAALGTYLRRIAMNLSLNALKQRKRSTLRFISRDESPQVPDTASIPPSDIEAIERQDVVRGAIAQLGETQRAVVVLRLMEGLSTNETASALDVPPGTVMSRLARGMAELHRLLAPYALGGLDVR